MTLSILWRSEGRLHLASDSRISFAGSGATDIGVKVMRLPIRVRGTELDQLDQHNILLDATYGFSYAGSLVNAATFKHLIEDLLIDIQYIPADEPLSFIEICRFLGRYSELVSTEIMSRLAENGAYTFFIAGWCPLIKNLRGARFHLRQESGKTVATFEEIVENDGTYVALGSGAPEFIQLMRDRPVSWHNILLTLNQVIDEEKIPTVGGDIQYGSFNRLGNFSASGLVRVSNERAVINGQTFGPSEQRIMKYRGFHLYNDWNPESDRFWPSPNFIEISVPSNRESNDRFIEDSRKLFNHS